MDLIEKIKNLNYILIISQILASIGIINNVYMYFTNIDYITNYFGDYNKYIYIIIGIAGIYVNSYYIMKKLSYINDII